MLAQKVETTSNAGTGNLHQDDALVVDESEGDLTVKEEWGSFECSSDRDCGNGRYCDRLNLWVSVYAKVCLVSHTSNLGLS